MTATWRDEGDRGVVTFDFRRDGSAGRIDPKPAQRLMAAVHDVLARTPSWRMRPIEVSLRA
jgi:hypothetical protein